MNFGVPELQVELEAWLKRRTSNPSFFGSLWRKRRKRSPPERGCICPPDCRQFRAPNFYPWSIPHWQEYSH